MLCMATVTVKGNITPTSRGIQNQFRLSGIEAVDIHNILECCSYLSYSDVAKVTGYISLSGGGVHKTTTAQEGV